MSCLTTDDKFVKRASRGEGSPWSPCGTQYHGWRNIPVIAIDKMTDEEFDAIAFDVLGRESA